MRLLFITNKICGPNGLERVLALRTSYLADILKYEVHIITFNQGEENLFYDFSNKIVFHDLTARGTSIKFIYDYICALNRKVKEINPDIITVCDDGLKGLFVPLLIRCKKPFVYERHTTKDINISKHKRYAKFLSFIMNYGSSLYDKFVVLTDNQASQWPMAKIEVIANPLSFFPDTPSSLVNNKIIAVGSRSYIKGYDLLLKAWASIAHKFPDWNIDIYGSKSDLDLESMIGEYALQKSFFLHDPVKNISDKYLESAIFVSSSRFEGFGMSIIEAMACALPCISFDCPSGPSMIIDDKMDGLLVRPEDVDCLAIALTALIEDEDLRFKLAKNARVSVRRFLLENIIKKWDLLYLKLSN